MFLAAVVPFASIAMPMLAGAMLTVVVIENGAKAAMMVYIAVSLLSVFMVPDIDAKLLFIMFFGYYNVLKPLLDKMPHMPVRYAVKLLIFNISMIISYYLSLYITGLDEAVAGWLGNYGPFLMLLGLNFVFLMYDYTMTQYIKLYVNWFRPTFLRR